VRRTKGAARRTVRQNHRHHGEKRIRQVDGQRRLHRRRDRAARLVLVALHLRKVVVGVRIGNVPGRHRRHRPKAALVDALTKVLVDALMTRGALRRRRCEVKCARSLRGNDAQLVNDQASVAHEEVARAKAHQRRRLLAQQPNKVADVLRGAVDACLEDCDGEGVDGRIELLLLIEVGGVLVEPLHLHPRRCVGGKVVARQLAARHLQTVHRGT